MERSIPHLLPPPNFYGTTRSGAEVLPKAIFFARITADVIDMSVSKVLDSHSNLQRDAVK